MASASSFDKMPEYLVKYHARKVLRDLLLVAAPFVECSIQEGGVGPVAEDERVAAEEKIEDAKSVLVPRPQHISLRSASKYAVARGRAR